MENVATVIGIVGGILGFIAFIWQTVLAIIAHLHISLKIEKAISDSYPYTALVTIENKGVLRKRLDYALLLIAPENEFFQDTFKNLAYDFQISQLSGFDIQYLKTHMTEPKYAKNKQRAIIPIPFLFQEQEGIGVEQVSCRCTLDAAKLENGIAYSVKLIIYDVWPLLRFVRCRATQDLLVLG